MILLSLVTNSPGGRYYLQLVEVKAIDGLTRTKWKRESNNNT